MNADPSGEIIHFIIAGAIMGAFNAASKGGNFGDILLGAIIGGIAGGLGAGVGNLAAGGTFFGASVLSSAGFAGGFVAGFAGGFVGGFVGATLNGLAAGQNIGEAISGGLRAGLTAGVLAGLAAGIGAGVKARKAGGDFWSGKGANSEYWSATFDEMEVNEIKAKGIQPFKSQQPQAGDMSGLKKIDKVEIANTWDPVTNQRILSLDNKLQLKATNFINKVKSDLNINLRITDGYRSISEQNNLYAQGRTTPGKIVTYAKGGESLHNFGRAIDVVQMNNGIPIWNKLSPDIVNIATELGLSWGGYWTKPVDYPHFYIK